MIMKKERFSDMTKRILTLLCCTAAAVLSAQETVIDQSVPPAPFPETDPAMTAEAVKTPRPYTYVKVFRSNADPELYAEPADAADLFKQRDKLVLELHETKRRIIRTDIKAKELQQQITKLVNELTLHLESRETVKEINVKLKALDKQLDELPKKKTEKKK